MEPGEEVGRHRVGERPVAVKKQGFVVLEVPHDGIAGGCRSGFPEGVTQASYTGWEGFSPDPSQPPAVEVT
jgi:hypothetical protein